MRRASGGTVAAAALALIVGLAGCAPAADSDSAPPSQGPVGDAPAFTGPWADDYRDAYSRTTSDKQRRILADETITAQEYAEVHDDTNACMKDNGYYVTWEDGGAFSVGAADGKYPDDFQQTMDPILQACEEAHDGSITALYERSTVNPDNIDDRPATTKCLIENGLVPKGYSVQDYIRDYDADSLPFDEFDSRGQACRDDPFGLWAKRE